MKAAAIFKTIRKGLLITGVFGGTMFGGTTSILAEDSTEREPGREFVVGGDFNRPPYQFLGENGEVSGFDVDLMKAVARSAGLTATFQKPGPSGAFAADVQLEASFAKDLVRQSEAEVWQYLEPHSTQEHAVFVRKDSLYRNLKDLAGRDVIVPNGSHAREWLSRHGYKDHLIGVDTPSSGLALLSQGNYEAFVCDRYEGLHACRANGFENVKMLEGGVIPVETGFAILRHDGGLAESLEKGMRVVRQTGEYQKLRDRWLADLMPADKGLKLGAAYSYALWVLIPALIFLGSACVSFFTVRKRSLARILELERALEAAHERCHDLELEHARQRYVINQLSAVSLVDQLAGVSGNNAQLQH